MPATLNPWLQLIETIESITRAAAPDPHPTLQQASNPKEQKTTMTIHDCLTDPCPICAIENRLDFPTDTPWRGDQREFKKIVKDLKILRGDSSPDVERRPAASPTRDRTRPTLLAALSATRLARPYLPPTGSDYLCY
jgi:hypothetical protein